MSLRKPDLPIDFVTIRSVFMGGIGSGNFSWRRPRRDLVEHALVLDMTALNRARQLVPGTTILGRCAAVAPLDGSAMAITYYCDLTDLDDARIDLSFCVGGTGYHETVRLTATRLRLGGVRLWFLCPLTMQRVRALYLPAGKRRFASREAHGLSYRSQGESDLFRSITRAQNIRARLGGDLSIHSPFPARPRGMHNRTYERLRKVGLEIEIAALEALLVKESALTHRIRSSQPLEW